MADFNDPIKGTLAETLKAVKALGGAAREARQQVDELKKSRQSAPTTKALADERARTNYRQPASRGGQSAAEAGAAERARADERIRAQKARVEINAAERAQKAREKAEQQAATRQANEQKQAARDKAKADANATKAQERFTANQAKEQKQAAQRQERERKQGQAKQEREQKQAAGKQEREQKQAANRQANEQKQAAKAQAQADKAQRQTGMARTAERALLGSAIGRGGPPPPGGGGLPPVIPGGGDPERGARGVQSFTRAHQFASQEVARSSNALRAHGAATTEAIEAAARGTLTYREWGYQIAATAGKFGAWIGASIPVFAALGAVQQVGKGAIASSSGVDGLRRSLDNVDPEAARGAFRSLATEFNVPIEDAADAVELMARRFQNLPQAQAAAKSALLASKTGDVPIEETSRSLIAISNAFGLAGDKLDSVADQVNEAQNTFAIPIGETYAGLERAAAPFANLGGDRTSLLALIGTGITRAGRSGREMSTILGRSAGYMQRPGNQEKMREFGIDPSQDIVSIIEQAMALAGGKGKGLEGVELQKLATALSTPQYAPVFTAVLENEEYFQTLRKGVTPEASKGSGAEELEKVKARADEEIKAIGIRLQTLGANLDDAGILLPFFGIVKLLERGLTLANSILDVFNKLPNPQIEVPGLGNVGPMEAAGAAVPFYGALRLARRTQVGGRFEEGSRANRFFSPSPERLAKLRIEDTFRTTDTDLREGALSHKKRAQGDLRLADTATRRDNRAQADFDFDPSEENRVRKEATANARERALITAEDTKVSGEMLDESIKEHRVEKADFDQRKKQRGFSYVGYGRETGIPVIDSSDRPTAVPVGTIGGAQPQWFQEPVDRRLLAIGPGGRPPRERQPRQARIAAYRDRTRAPLSRAFAPLIVGARDLGRGAIDAAREGNRAGRAADRARRAGVGAAAAMRAAGSKIGGWGRDLRGMFGPMELALIGIIAIPAVIDKIKDSTAKAAARLKRASSPGTPVKDLEREAERGSSFGELLSDVPGSVRDTFKADKREDSGSKRRRLAQQSLEIRETREATNEHHKKLGLPLLLQNEEQINKRIRRAKERKDAAEISLDTFNEEMDRAEAEIAAGSPNFDEPFTQKGKERLLALAGTFRRAGQREGGSAGFREALFGGGLRTTPFEELEVQVATMEQVAAFRDANQAELDKLSSGALNKITRLMTSSDPIKRAEAPGALQSFTQGIAQGAQQELDRGLLFARNREDRAAAYAKAEEKIGSIGEGPEVQAQVKALTKDRNQAKEALDEGRGATISVPLPGGLRAGLGKDHSKIKALVADLKAKDKELDAFLKAQGISREEREAIAKQLEDSRFDEATTVIQSRGNLRAVRANAGFGRLRVQIQNAGVFVRRQIKRFGQGSAEVLDALAAEEQLNQQLAREGFDLRRIRDERRTIPLRNLDNPVPLARAEAGNARRALADMRANRQNFSQNEIEQGINAVMEADASTAKALEDWGKQANENAIDLIRSRSELRQSTTSDPVARAQEEARLAQQLLARGGFENEAEANRARAYVNNTRREAIKAARDAELDLMRARSELRQSRTDNPVVQAREEAGLASKILAKGGFENPAEEMRARAQRNTTRRDASRIGFEDKLDTIMFRLDMEDITKEAAISQLAALERQVRDMSGMRDLKRRLRQEGKALRDEADSEYGLSFDGIKLPSLYEIRRAVSTGNPTGGNAVQNNNQIVVNVNDPNAVDGVARVLEEYVGAQGSIARAMGAR